MGLFWKEWIDMSGSKRALPHRSPYGAGQPHLGFANRGKMPVASG